MLTHSEEFYESSVHCASITEQNLCSSPAEAGCHSVHQEIHAFYWGKMFITLFTTAHHWTLSWVRWIQSLTLQPISIKLMLTLPPPHLTPQYLLISLICLPFQFTNQNTICNSQHSMHAKFHTNHNLLHFITIIEFGKVSSVNTVTRLCGR